MTPRRSASASPARPELREARRRTCSRSSRTATSRRCARRTADGGRGAEIERLADVFGALGAMGLGDFVRFDLSIVRGLAYYTGIVFELFDAGRAARHLRRRALRQPA